MSYQLTIEPLGTTIEVEEGQTVLDAALRQGIYLPHACCHGLCGTCKLQVSDGEVDHGAANPFALMDFERDEGKTLACCCTLQSDATIEADIDEEPDAEVIPVRDFAATVTRIVDLTPTIKALHLQLESPTGRSRGDSPPSGGGPARSGTERIRGSTCPIECEPDSARLRCHSGLLDCDALRRRRQAARSDLDSSDIALLGGRTQPVGLQAGLESCQRRGAARARHHRAGPRSRPYRQDGRRRRLMRRRRAVTRRPFEGSPRP